MPAIVVTRAVSQPLMSWLNWELSPNMPNMFVTDDVSHAPISSLNWPALRLMLHLDVSAPFLHWVYGVKRQLIVVTRDVSQVAMGPYACRARSRFASQTSRAVQIVASVARKMTFVGAAVAVGDCVGAYVSDVGA